MVLTTDIFLFSFEGEFARAGAGWVSIFIFSHYISRLSNFIDILKWIFLEVSYLKWPSYTGYPNPTTDTD